MKKLSNMETRFMADMTVELNVMVRDQLRLGGIDLAGAASAVVRDRLSFLSLGPEEFDEIVEVLAASSSVVLISLNGDERWYAGIGDFTDELIENARYSSLPEQKADLLAQATGWQETLARNGEMTITFNGMAYEAKRIVSSDVAEGKFRPASWDEMVGAGVGFERIRRITGYLVGTLERFNDAKRCEERDRVKHGMGQ